MTRETKVGLAVSASFLCLVGGVLAVKHFRDTQPPKTAEMVKAEEEARQPPAIEMPPGGLPGLGSESNVPPAPPTEMLEPLKPSNTPAASTTVERPLTPPAPLAPPPGSKPKPPPASRIDNPDEDDSLDPPPPPLSAPVRPVRHDEPILPVPADLPKPAAPRPQDLPKPLDLPETDRAPALVPPPQPVGAKRSDGPVISPIGAKDDKPIGDKLPAPPPVVGELMPGLMLPPIKLDPKGPMSGVKDPPTVPLPAQMGDKLTLPGDPPPVPRSNPMVGAKPMDIPKPVDVPKPIDVPKPPIDVAKPMGPTPLPMDLTKPANNALLDVPPKKVGLEPSEPMPPRAGGPTLPPGLKDNPPAAALDPRPRPAELQEPRVESYDEEWYYCKQGDTLEAISQKFFFSPKYEQALRQYNLDRNFSPAFRAEKPSLAQGNIVKVPPARILERSYPNAIPGFRPTGNPRPAAVVSPGIAPEPIIPGPAAGSAEDLGAPHEFVVRREGMTVKDIAKEELRSADQWQRIFLLNRWVNPNEPLPVGTKIFLPRGQ